jgi:hypothetical protein
MEIPQNENTFRMKKGQQKQKMWGLNMKSKLIIIETGISQFIYSDGNWKIWRLLDYQLLSQGT